jgi:hypothetical protein
MKYTQEQISDAFETRANLFNINLEEIPEAYLVYMIYGALFCDFSTKSIFESYIDESLRIGKEHALANKN